MPNSVGESLEHFQAALLQTGDTLDGFMSKHYIGKWMGDDLYHAMAIRTTMVAAMHNFLTDEGLFNMERVSLSPVTDPLAHDIEHTPVVPYKGHSYVTTHSMIYSKFLACFNPRVKGIFVDSPNIRLELASPTGEQRGRYLIDFSQMDVEVRRPRSVSLEQYLNEPDTVAKILEEDRDGALTFFERMVCDAIGKVAAKNGDDLRALEVRLESPPMPFPRFYRDEAVARYGASGLEEKLATVAGTQFYWILGLMRENYDVIYPYLRPDGSKKPISQFTSRMIYNYDLCAQSFRTDTGKAGRAFEVLSGAVREWLYEPIVERLLDNRVIRVRPKIVDGCIENIEELEGYGPFLLAASKRDGNGTPLFPSTFGGGIGVERTLMALLNGKRILKVDDATLFGKNPDSHPLYLF